MTVPFNQIPNDRLVPFVYAEFDNSRAAQGPGVQSYKTVLVGQRRSTGTKAAESLSIVTSLAQAETYFGRGSQLADMFRSFFENNIASEVWGVPLSDGGGAAASGSIVFSGTATESGTARLHVAGYRINVPVVSGDDGTDVATALETELAKAENGHLPVSYLRSGATVNLIAKNGGTLGNDIDVRLNYYAGEELPDGVSASITQPTGGSGGPDLQDAIDALGDEQFNVIVHPFSDATNIGAIEDELENRWGPLLQNDGVSICYKSDTYANLITYGDARNSPHSVVMGGYNSPTPAWRIAAALGANIAYYGQQDPARPIQNLELKGVLSPANADRFTNEERNTLLRYGVATFKVSNDGSTIIERCVTTYKTNAADAPDTSYRDVETVLTLSYIRWDWRNYILTRYARHKLASDGVRYSAGQSVVTPNLMKAEAVLKFKQWQGLGLVEGLEQFKRDLVVEINASDPNRIDILLPTDLINQLRVAATNIQFLL